MPVVCAVAGMSTGGDNTVSMMWMTPFDAGTSAVVTVAPPTVTMPLLTPNLTLSPLAIVASMPSVTALEGTSEETT